MVLILYFCILLMLGSSEVDTNSHSNDLTITHLNEVIDAVISEANEYADKPPEERTLPKLNRKPPPQSRQQRNSVGHDFNQNRFAANGLNQMSFLAGGAQFQQKLHEQFPNMVPFAANQNAAQAVVQQQQQQLMMHYNGQYQQQQQRQQQQYAQAAHFQALQNQQVQYQAVNAAALAQMHQLQRQQMQVCTVY